VVGRPRELHPLRELATGAALGLSVVAVATLAAVAGMPREELLHMLQEGRYNAPLLVAAIAATLAGQLTTLIYARRHRADLGTAWPGLRSMLAGVLCGLGVIGTWWLWGALAERLGISLHDQAILGLVRGLGYPVGWGIAFVVAIVGPIAEELVFRGWVQERLARWWSARGAIALVAVAFTLAHAETPSALPPIFVMAVVTGVLRERTRSTWPGLAAHLLNNGVAMGVVVSGAG
jgi:membrane protease YdiL (CAAX protease family)